MALLRRFAIKAEKLIVGHSAEGIGGGERACGQVGAVRLYFADDDVAVFDDAVEIDVGLVGTAIEQ